MSGVSSAAFVYDPRLARYALAPSHPFKPIRLDLVRTLLHACDALGETDEVPPDDMPDTALERVHEARYIDAVLRASREGPSPDLYAFGLGTGDNPVFDGMHDSARLVCAATLTAVRLVAGGRRRRAVSFAGGLHHAHAGRASGFCVYNDLAVGIAAAVEEFGLRVAYVDVDAHHGDGVQGLFYRDPRVMTISLHESGRYIFPGTGHTYEIGEGDASGTAVNVPLEPFTDGDSYLEAFEAVVPRAVDAFRPDMVVLQAGADMHFHDPLAHLAVDLSAMRASHRRVVELAERFAGGRLVATGGGGYDPYRTVPRAWAWVWSAVADRPLPDRVPPAWRERWAADANVEIPSRMLDQDEAARDVGRADDARSRNRATVERLLDQLEPIWSGWSRRGGTRSGG